MKKGISTIIATLLMLVITIALAGFAYTYLSGVLQSRTAVVFDVLDTSCSGDTIAVDVRNSGTGASGSITVSATQPDGSTSGGSCTIASLNAGTQGNCNIDRPVGAASGTYRIRITAGGAAPATASVFCSTAGV